jgi:hypothetical protein
MTSLRVVVNGYRLPLDVPLPPELDGVDVATLQIVVLVTRGMEVVSFAGVSQVVGEVVAHDPEPQGKPGRETV